MDGTRRTFHDAFSAKLAFVEIYVGNIVLHLDCTERTGLLAFAASYAGRFAGLPCSCALFHVYAGNEYAAVLRPLVAQLDDLLRTGLCTGTAAGTFLLINDRQTCNRVHRNGSELAGGNTVTAAEAAVEASGVAAVEGGLDLA